MKKLIIFILMLLVSVSVVNAGIDFDSVFYGGFANPGTSHSFSHTTSGDDRLLIVGTVGSSSSGSDLVTGVTYNSVAMIKINDSLNYNGRWISLWYLVNPALGTNTVTVTGSSSDLIGGASISYTGVNQLNPIDTNKIDTYTGASFTSTLASTLDNTWGFMYLRDTNGGKTYTSTTGDSVRLDANAGLTFIDTNSNITPAGSNTMSGTISASIATGDIFYLTLVPSGVVLTPIISIDDISLVNNSYFNSDINIQLNLSVTDTNENVNSSYSLNGGSFVQFGTNTLQPNVTLLKVIETPKQNTRFLYGATTWNHATATKYCNDNYNLDYISYDLTFVGLPAVDVTYYNNITWINATSTSYITNLHCGLDDDIYNITFQAENNETQTNSSQYTFTIDTTNPITNVITNQTEFNTFQVNMSEIFNYSDTNLDTCSITLTELENVSVNDTDTFACDTLYNFSTAGLHNLRINATDLAGNYNDTTQYNITINPYNYIYFRDSTNSTLLTTYDLTIYHPDGREVMATVQTNGSTILSPVNNGTLDIGLHTLEFSRLGYATENFTYNVTDSSAGDSQVFNVTRSKIILSIYNRETGNILTGLSTVTLVATNGFNSTTTTGYLNISQVNFLAEEYQIIVSHDGYATESIYFDYDNQENLPVSIYLLNSTSTNYGTATVELTADTGQLIQGAICKALEWKPSQSAFVSVAQGLTNSNGQTTLNIELNTDLYKFSCEKGGVLVVSAQEIITTTGTTIPLEMPTTLTTDYNIFTTLTYSFTNTTFNASHDTITFTWSENNGLVAQGCINIYNVKGTRKTLLSSNCATGSTSQKQVVTSINNSYNKQVEGVIIDVNGQSTKLGTIYYKSYYDLSRSLADYHLDIILPLLAVLIGIAIGLVLSPQNIYISQITVIILIWITAGLVPTVISGTIAVSVTMIAGLMLWGGFKVK